MIRVQIPDMPSADEVLPYLRRIDETKTYVNRGPLVSILEARLSELCGVPVVTVSSGTAALELALRANDLRYSERVLMPALTFAATGLAALSAGLRPVLHDVDPQTWRLNRAGVLKTKLADDAYLADQFDQGHDWVGGPIKAVMPVAAFGHPIEADHWVGCDVPVIIDAAGAFPAQKCSQDPNITTCFSLHATKFIGCGEGGFVASANQDLLNRVRELSMFGPYGTNAKLSEYHAAVALASLDRLYEKRQRIDEISILYAKHGLNLFKSNLNIGCSTLLVVELPNGGADYVQRQLGERCIETRQWYRAWLDEREEFGKPELPVTEYLRQRLLGLPFHNYLTEADVAKVMTTLREVTQC